MKSSTILMLFLLSFSMQNNSGRVDYRPDPTRFLLLDQRIIQTTKNAKLEVGKVEKHASNPLFFEDRDWEMRFDNLYGNVIFDEEQQIYKCWYSPFVVDSTAQGMTLDQRNRKYQPPRNREMGICYATSKDGIHWEKPNLGIVEYNGNKENNIVWRGPHGAGVFKDLQESDPDKRYKMLMSGMAVSYSSDGINWKEKIKIQGVSVAGDTHNNAFWAPSLDKYVGITRTWITKEGRKGREREVARIESEDFERWTKEETVLQGEDFDLQTYAMPTFYYAGVYLGLIAIHEQSSDRVWTELSWSPDTKEWFRIDASNPLIPTSEKKLDYDYGCVYACAYPIFEENQIRLYYGGSDWLHFGWRNGSLNLATLRPDGFAGYVPVDSSQVAAVVTRLFSHRGAALKLTADVEKEGSVKVMVMNSAGEQIATSNSITRTITDGVLQFNHKINEEKISLRIEIEKAKVYSFSLE